MRGFCLQGNGMTDYGAIACRAKRRQDFKAFRMGYHGKTSLDAAFDACRRFLFVSHAGLKFCRARPCRDILPQTVAMRSSDAAVARFKRGQRASARNRPDMRSEVQARLSDGGALRRRDT